MPTPKPTYTLNGGGVGGSPMKPSKSNADKYLDYTTWAIETTETKQDYNDTIKKIVAAGKKYGISNSIVQEDLAAFKKNYGTGPKPNQPEKSKTKVMPSIKPSPKPKAE
jgi:hypothetical protein